MTAPPNPLPRFACQTGELLRNPPAGSPAGAFKTRIKKLSRTPQHQPAKPIRHRKHNPVTLSLSTISPPLNLAEISLPSGSYLNWKILHQPTCTAARHRQGEQEAKKTRQEAGLFHHRIRLARRSLGSPNGFGRGELVAPSGRPEGWQQRNSPALPGIRSGRTPGGCRHR